LCADFCAVTAARHELTGGVAWALTHERIAKLEVQRDEMGRELEALVKQDNKQM
jgi:hypothetical protein